MEQLTTKNPVETLESFTEKAVEAAKTYMLARKSYQNNKDVVWESWDDYQAKNHGEYFAEDFGKSISEQDGLRLGSPFSGDTKLFYRKNRMYPGGTFIMDSNEIGEDHPDFEEYKKFEDYVAQAFFAKGIPFTKEY